MREPISSMHTGHVATAQAGQLVSFADCRENKISEVSFSDNLDYLQALEKEGQLILAHALLRQRGAEWQAKPDYVQVMSMAGLTPADSKPEKLEELVALTEQQNRRGAEVAEQKDVTIYFTKFCRENKIDAFNRKLLLLLLLLATNNRFKDMFDLCDFGEKVRDDNGIKISTVLNILCGDYREQLASRKYFSMDSTLIRQEILNIESDKSNIFERYVALNDRHVRYFVGDNNFYKSASGLIQRNIGLVRLDQVIMPEDTKKELVARVALYLSSRNSRKASLIDDFYGYGTGLTLLFHGPSGTGKTMTAQALACHFNRQLYSLKMSEFVHHLTGMFDDAIKDLFLEASLNSGIVYFDEADDFFEKDSYYSRVLLIEIEKAHCVVILSTNRPAQLDPALDRRLSLKVCFAIPDADLRYKIWQALTPGFATLAPDVDLRALAERYNFTGGLIKNSIFMALLSSLPSDGRMKSLITMDMIEQACKLQLQQMYNMDDLYQVYKPSGKFKNVQTSKGQEIELTKVADIYRNLKEKQAGLNILVTCIDIQTGIDVVESLASECNLKIKKVDYANVLKCSSSEYNKMFDPITQTKKDPLELAFAESTGDASLLLFVDYHSNTKWTEDKNHRWENIDQMLVYYDLLINLRAYQGLFCMVTMPALSKIPREFNLHFNLDYPPEDIQILHWKEHFNGCRYCDLDLMTLVKTYPMHFAEIDYYAKQALVQAAIEDGSGELTIKNINKIVERYRKQQSKPPLFGRFDGADSV